VNASLQFDPERMEPTYHLVKGRPGRSYGLAIARRLGFPPAVLDRAEGYQEGDEARMDDLLERLERRETESEARLQQLQGELERAERVRTDVEGRERALREAERSARERSREEARRLLMEARQEVEAAIVALRAEAAAGEDLEEAARNARRRVEVAATRAASRDPVGTDLAAAAAEIAVGDRVRVHASGAKGRVLELRDRRALVAVGALRLELPLEDVEPLGGGAVAAGAEAPRGGWSGPALGQVRTEVDLRGLRVDEIEVELFRALDAAVLEDLAELRIIHGKGTGALRQRVGELLSGDPRVTVFRMGTPQEGGGGVTVAVLR
ncbi:MAG: Smr/MutS family protein, partial [Longimicrobiales bacterium]|nr:Smr/MutS family protein [Longimicrobiales bacterium]